MNARAWNTQKHITSRAWFRSTDVGRSGLSHYNDDWHVQIQFYVTYTGIISMNSRAWNTKNILLAERGFDPRTSGLWAQHASTAPLC